MNKQKHWFNFILYMEMKGTKKKLLNEKKWISKNIVQLHIIYGNERYEKEIAEWEKMNKQKHWFNFILYMEMKSMKKK